MVRLAGHRYVIDTIIRFSSSLLIFIGIFLNVYLLIIGIALLSFTAYNANKSYKELQAADGRLIELQTQRSALCAEFVMKCQCETSHTDF